MASLYTQLSPINKDVADAYQKVINAAKDGKINKAGAEAFFSIKVTGSDPKAAFSALKALFLIFHKGEFTADGLEFWEKRLVAFFLKKGTGKLLRQDKDLKPIEDALEVAAKHVLFVSPKLSITYNASQYQAIKQLVKDRAIHVILVDDTALPSGDLASYKAEADTLLVASKAKAEEITLMVLHEMTHAVQDWNDVKGLSEHLEADAWICEHLARRIVAGPLAKDALPFEAVENWVTKGKAKPGDPAWSSSDPKKPGAYDRLATDLVDAGAVIDAGKTRDLTNAESGTPEKQILADVMKKLKAASAAPAPKKP